MGLSDVLKKIQKDYGDSVVKFGVDELSADGILSLGSPSFDYCVYGGVPEGRIVEFSGPEGSGKTTSAFRVAASYQRKEIERNPDNPRAIILLDNEGTADPIWAKTLGYDMSEKAKVQTVIIRPEAQSAEQIFDMAIDMLKTGEVGLLIFDSIATLVPQQIIDESQEKKQMGGISNSLTRFANTAVGLLRKYKATLIGINQVRENLSGYGDFLQTPGGRAWKHQCSMRLMFKRGDFFDEEGNKLTTKAESPAGHTIEVAVLKTKVCRWDRKVGTMSLNYTKGVDIVADTVLVAIHLGLIDNSVQGFFKLLDPDTKEVLIGDDGKEIKIRGKKNISTYFNDHPDVFKRLYNKVYELLEQRESSNFDTFARLVYGDEEDMREKFNLTDKDFED